ncbi:hypothetical protein LHP98_04545 [Rhodobacter sp. Har01]|nr:hypothetical protein [Rhodobacter sp. Har01]MCB6177398.1 hypothetical protein [Rhodobacter sp. Har01]
MRLHVQILAATALALSLGFGLPVKAAHHSALDAVGTTGARPATTGLPDL